MDGFEQGVCKIQTGYLRMRMGVWMGKCGWKKVQKKYGKKKIIKIIIKKFLKAKFKEETKYNLHSRYSEKLTTVCPI